MSQWTCSRRLASSRHEHVQLEGAPDRSGPASVADDARQDDGIVVLGVAGGVHEREPALPGDVALVAPKRPYLQVFVTRKAESRRALGAAGRQFESRRPDLYWSQISTSRNSAWTNTWTEIGPFFVQNRAAGAMSGAGVARQSRRSQAPVAFGMRSAGITAVASISTTHSGRARPSTTTPVEHGKTSFIQRPMTWYTVSR